MHVPIIILQERIQQQRVEIPGVVPVPMAQEEIAHVPTIIQHAPAIVQHDRIHQQQVAMIAEAPAPMTQEGTACVPTNIPQVRIGGGPCIRAPFASGAPLGSDAPFASSA